MKLDKIISFPKLNSA